MRAVDLILPAASAKKNEEEERERREEEVSRIFVSVVNVLDVKLMEGMSDKRRSNDRDVLTTRGDIGKG